MREGSSINTKCDIAVVMPVTQCMLAASLMVDMDIGTYRPSKVIIIDDSDTGFAPPVVGYEVDYTRISEWKGVNYYWNIGVAKAKIFEFTCIINDDMTIHKYFFEMAVKALTRDPKAACACPFLVPSLKEVKGGGRIQTAIMMRREGGAFTFKNSVLRKIPPIPPELTMFFGDDWFYEWSKKLGYHWIKVVNSCIYHHGSLGVRQRELRKLLEPERVKWERLVMQYNLPYRKL